MQRIEIVCLASRSNRLARGDSLAKLWGQVIKGCLFTACPYSHKDLVHVFIEFVETGKNSKCQIGTLVKHRAKRKGKGKPLSQRVSSAQNAKLHLYGRRCLRCLLYDLLISNHHHWWWMGIHAASSFHMQNIHASYDEQMCENYWIASCKSGKSIDPYMSRMKTSTYGKVQIQIASVTQGHGALA